MNILAYIESGVLEAYCLGSLPDAEAQTVMQMIAAHPQVRNEVEQIQKAMEMYARSQSIHPPAHLQDTIYTLIANLQKEKEMLPDDLPLINKFSNYHAWMGLMPKTVPINIKEERYCKVLTQTSTVTQMLVISTTDFEDEIHTDLYESFLILSGECICTVNGAVRHMKAGDFMDIPLHANHDVVINTPTVTAILQRLAI